MMTRSRPITKHTAKYRLVLPFRTTLCLDGACVVLCAFAGLVQADDAKPLQLDTITVVDRESPYIAVDNNDTATAYKVGSEGISLFGSSGNSNPYMVINRLPSVYAPSVDAYGLVNIPGGNKGLRVRGELSSHGGGGTVDGLPLTGVNPGPGNQWLFDMENMAGVTLRQGPVAPDRFAFFTTGGVIDNEILWPKAQRGLHLGQSYGTNNFMRTFARADSGQLADGSALFLSGSFTDADKWRGDGSSPNGRTNVEAAWSRPLGDRGKGKLLFSYNDAKADNYRPLTYAQASDLNTWRNFDYSSASSATPSTAVNYYGYNRQSFRNWTVLGEFEYAVNDTNKLSFKPYYLSEKGEYFDGMANGKVRQWLIDHDWYGMTAEWQTRFADTEFKFGYWGESSAPPGPPTAWKMFNPTATGGLSGASWSILADTTNRHYFHSVYAMADRSFSALKTQLGVRYMRETVPGFNFYNTTGIGDVSFDQALAQSSGVVANRSAGSFSLNEFLPFAAFNYTLTPATNIKLSLGRNYGSPAFDVWPVFQQNSAALIAKGLDADTLWHNIKAETSDAVDLGLDMHLAQGYFAPTVYYARHHNKSVSYDPGVGVAYSQNIGDTQAYGAQAAAGWSPLDNIDLFATASYNRNEFVKDLPLQNGSSLAVNGQQLPDVPEWMANAGGTWHRHGFSVSPMVRYTGSRFGDTQHLQNIAGYFTTDITFAYQHRFNIGKFGASLAVQNLFDKKYIGFINASYYQLLSNSSAIYYPGAPRTLVAQVTFDF